MNRLAGETSLYLRQHAGNPVDWHPWGPEALATARESKRPIFLSVGYSACHWCHVMEHECFEDPAVAAVMNEHFVNVKVDREERPDLDQIYMAAHHLLNQGEGGGWPLNVFLTPDLAPFFAGTYFPPDDRHLPHRPSFPRLLRGIAEAWANKRGDVTALGRGVAEGLAELGAVEASPGDLSADLLANALAALKAAHDPENGGFGGAPKFPHPLDLAVLLRLARRLGDAGGGADALAIARLTLEKMARGGVYDQVGGGFHRYSVDDRWLVPHFEKMLYDNALLPPAYVEAFQLTGDPFYRQIACETLDYVLREMTSPAGGFYSTQDADSEGVEGKFFVWSGAEVDAVLGPAAGRLVRSVYGVTDRGNFEGHNVLHRENTDGQDARLHGLGLDDFQTKLTDARAMLYEARAARVAPGRDEKILTAWNGLMVGAFARAGAALGVPRYVGAAADAAGFVLAHLRGPDGRLFRTCGVGQPAKLAGYLEDYAYLCDALVSLYEATFDPTWVAAAVGLADAMLTHFADPAAGGFFYTADDHERLIARTKDTQDGSTPSGNATAATALLRLAALTGRRDFAAAAAGTLRLYRGLLADHPVAAGQMLVALDLHLGPVDEVAVVGPANDPETVRALAAIRARFDPNRVVAFHDPATGPPPAGVPLLADKPARGAVTVYVCRDFACQAPLVGAAAVEAAFGSPGERRA